MTPTGDPAAEVAAEGGLGARAAASSAESSETFRPYRGVQSYEAEDADLFFGRDQEAQRLVASILSSRATVLHAPSGAGKSSLLNARIIPDLEAQGWTPVRTRPEENPIEAVRDAALEAVLVDPLVESRALEQAWAALAPGVADPSLGELISAFDALGTDPHVAKRLATARIAFPVDNRPGQTIHRRSFVSRVLRAALPVERFLAHLGAMLDGTPAAAVAPPLTSEVRVRELQALLRSELAREAYQASRDDLVLPVPGLAPFFLNLWEVHASLGLRLDMVLIIDQFEELFARFVDRPGDLQAPRAGLRRLFFQQLRELYRLRLPASGARSGEPVDERADFPVRFVIAMREDYLGHLSSLRRALPELDDRWVRLDFLTVDEARLAVAKPARLFGYSYEPECYQAILEGLTREAETDSDGRIAGGYIEPTPLQIVCDELWQSVASKKLDSSIPLEAAVISLDDVRALLAEGGEPSRQPEQKPGGLVAEILRKFFLSVLRPLPWRDRFETIDLLESLVTGGGTRNIVERSSLLAGAFWSAARREELLDRLVAKRILRCENRLGSEFVEITHEFLIAPIVAESVESMRQPETRRLRKAVVTLSRVMRDEDKGTTSPLQRADFDDIDACRQSLQWDGKAVERMLRSAIVLGVEPERLRGWVRTFMDSGSRGVSPRRALAERDYWLGLHGQLQDSPEVTRTELEMVWRGAIRWVQDGETDAIRYWTRRYLEDDQRSSADH